jgi:hypothetical protein
MANAPAGADPRDILAITAVKARYFRFIDTKNWEGLRSLFTDDADLDYPSLGQFDSVDEAVRRLAARLVQAVTIHHGHMPEVELTAPDEAVGIFAMFDRLIPTPGTVLPGPEHLRHGRQGFGHYTDTFRRGDDGWRISSLKLTRLHVEPCVPTI